MKQLALKRKNRNSLKIKKPRGFIQTMNGSVKKSPYTKRIINQKGAFGTSEYGL